MRVIITVMRAPVVVLLFSLAACGDVPDAIIDAASTIDTAAASCLPACATNATCTGTTCACNAGFEGDGLTCTAIQHWNQIGSATIALDLGNNRGFMATGHAQHIYFAPVTDFGQTTTFRAFDVDTAIMSGRLSLPPGTQNDFEASGFGAIFVADRTGLFLMGDDGQRYDPTTDTWTDVPGYGNGPSGPSEFHRGESAGAWDGTSNTILMVGGRDGSNTDQATAIRRNVDGTWANEPGALPFTISNAIAYAPPTGGQIYVAGGNASDSNRRHLVVHTTGTSTWTVLPSAPADLDRAIGMGHHVENGVTRIFVATPRELLFYNLTASAWDRRVDMPVVNALAQVVMVEGVAHAMVRNGGVADVYELISIE